jgi:hypothetical protein
MLQMKNSDKIVAHNTNSDLSFQDGQPMDPEAEPTDTRPLENTNVAPVVAFNATAPYPAIDCCKIFKFVFVISPHRPAFSPVTMSSSFRSVE